jgi:hypothetical protein
VRQRLEHWQKDADLAGLRDAEALAKLPEVEREAWRSFWTDVQDCAALVGHASSVPGHAGTLEACPTKTL